MREHRKRGVTWRLDMTGENAQTSFPVLFTSIPRKGGEEAEGWDLAITRQRNYGGPLNRRANRRNCDTSLRAE